MKLIFASHNEHKTTEIRQLLPPDIQLLSLNDLNYHDEIEESAATLEGNALLKARHVFTLFKLPCFADDSGLEVEALENRPGVYSARYAGEPKNDDRNIYYSKNHFSEGISLLLLLLCPHHPILHSFCSHCRHDPNLGLCRGD
jgi:XTP/dITP diphosphohydrolase